MFYYIMCLESLVLKALVVWTIIADYTVTTELDSQLNVCFM